MLRIRYCIISRLEEEKYQNIQVLWADLIRRGNHHHQMIIINNCNDIQEWEAKDHVVDRPDLFCSTFKLRKRKRKRQSSRLLACVYVCLCGYLEMIAAQMARCPAIHLSLRQWVVFGWAASSSSTLDAAEIKISSKREGKKITTNIYIYIYKETRGAIANGVFSIPNQLLTLSSSGSQLEKVNSNLWQI